ncbi:MAG: hypothetical protein Q4F72_07895, partial [Desulfovibrionaceae bacterium]|nr:hypothetical protein [Desulfovibrionaceae bacterium]MDO5537432.1 hypothetical protein [Desulfovibrionaceae bacterium]
MRISESTYLETMRAACPWWEDAGLDGLPAFERPVVRSIFDWITGPASGGRAGLLPGARQTGRTTIARQVIRRLLDAGVPGRNILYAA